MKQLALALVAIAPLVGCTSVPSDADRIDSASYVGDRSGVVLDEVIAAVPSEGRQMGFVNVHVTLAGVINPKRTSFSRVGDVRSIILRSSPRISSAVVATVQQNPSPIDNISILRDDILRDANRVFMAEFSKWTSAEDYDVQIVVTSLYLTNGAVGRSPSGRSW